MRICRPLFTWFFTFTLLGAATPAGAQEPPPGAPPPVALMTPPADPAGLEIQQKLIYLKPGGRCARPRRSLDATRQYNLHLVTRSLPPGLRIQYEASALAGGAAAGLVARF